MDKTVDCKDLMDFISKWLYCSALDFRKGWPCPDCSGKGWIYDPNDPPCPIEGNKCRDRLKCIHCKATGYDDNNREYWEQAYLKELKDKKEREKQDKKDLRKVISILKRIPSHSLDFLELYARHHTTWNIDKLNFLINIKKSLDK